MRLDSIPSTRAQHRHLPDSTESFGVNLAEESASLRVQPGRSWFSRVCYPQFFGLRERSAQKIRRVKSTLAIVESDDYASPKSVHGNDAGALGVSITKIMARMSPPCLSAVTRAVFSLATNKAPVVGADSLLLRVRSWALQNLEDVFGFEAALVGHVATGITGFGLNRVNTTSCVKPNPSPR